MSAHALYLVRMDVAHDHEATFNEVYDREHVPNLRAVAGVRRASRYRQPSPIEPRYLAAYEMDGPGVVESAAWKTAGELGQWRSEEHTSELQSRSDLVCRLLLEKKKTLAPIGLN